MKSVAAHLLISFLFLYFSTPVSAAKVDTVSIHSNKMQKDFSCIVIRPAAYSKHRKHRFPVVYLLHGYSGSFNNWIRKVPELKDFADEFGQIIVCPEGAFGSWYFDSELNKDSQFETYVAEEVPDYIDAHYRTDTARTARAITGLSMGGHGAFYIAWRHAQHFGAVASMSGGVDLSQSANKFQIEKVIGAYATSPEAWKSHSIINIVDNSPPDSLAIYFDCGTSDMFIEGNRKLHAKLLEKKIAHEYLERKGNHNWDYWKYSIHFQLLFFKKYFDSVKKK